MLKLISLQLEEDLIMLLKEKAKQDDRSVSSIIRIAIRKYLELD